VKPFVTAIACAVILLIAVRVYHLTRRPAPPAPVVADHEVTAPLILPATSASWSNLTSRAPVEVATRRPTTNIAPAAAAQPGAPAYSESALQSRTRELLARAAVTSVGVNPDSDQYWLAAITDENLSAEDRRELILALNDVRRTGPDDLPLIASRIALIEQAAPQAVDEADAAAFQEVYRELLIAFTSLAAAQSATEPAEPVPNAEPAR